MGSGGRSASPEELLANLAQCKQLADEPLEWPEAHPSRERTAIPASHPRSPVRGWAQCSRLHLSGHRLGPGCQALAVSDQQLHEQGLSLFIVGEWRARFRESLAPGKRRNKLRSQLPHFSHIDGRFTTLVPPHEQNASALYARLRARGAGERCYLLSEAAELDGRELPLDEALTEVVDKAQHLATFISCEPGRLAYFHDEEPESRYLLERPS